LKLLASRVSVEGRALIQVVALYWRNYVLLVLPSSNTSPIVSQKGAVSCCRVAHRLFLFDPVVSLMLSRARRYLSLDRLQGIGVLT